MSTGGNDERIRLVLDTVGKQGLDDLKRAAADAKDQFSAFRVEIERTTSAKRRVFDLGARMKTAEAEMFAARIAQQRQEQEEAERTEAIMDRAMRRTVSAHNASQKAVAQSAEADRDSAKAKMGAAQAALELSRGLEDLATGGFMGILNNIPRMVEGVGRAIGLTLAKVMALSTAVTMTATAVYVLFRNWDQVTEVFGKSGVPTEDLIGKMGRLEKAIKGNKDELDKLTQSTSMSVTEIERYNKLTEETARLEKLKADEMERQQRIKRVDEAKDPKVVGEMASAKEVMQTLMSDKDAIVRAIQDSMPQAAIQAVNAQLNQVIRQRHEAFTRGDLAERKRIPEYDQEIARLASLRNQKIAQRQGDAKVLFDKAMEGDAAAIAQLAGVPGLTPGQRSVIDVASPEYQAAQRRAKHENVEFFRQRDVMTDELNRQGAEFEAAGKIDNELQEAAAKLINDTTQHMGKVWEDEVKARVEIGKEARDAQRKHQDWRDKKTEEQTRMDVDLLKKGTIDEEAAAALAQARAMGGWRDEMGNLVRATPQQQNRALVEDLHRNLAATNPAFQGARGRNAAVQIATEANRAFEQEVLRAQQEHFEATKTNLQQSQAIVAASMRMAAQLRQVQAQLWPALHQLNAETNQNGRSQLRTRLQ
jgi:hypothetical protein